MSSRVQGHCLPVPARDLVGRARPREPRLPATMQEHDRRCRMWTSALTDEDDAIVGGHLKPHGIAVVGQEPHASTVRRGMPGPAGSVPLMAAFSRAPDINFPRVWPTLP